MKLLKTELIPALLFIIASAIGYTIHFLLFRDLHHIFIYLVGDISFVFIEVFLVTLIIHRLLDERDRRMRMVRLNMVIGAFFSEFGREMLTVMAEYDRNRELLEQRAAVDGTWKPARFAETMKWISGNTFSFDPHDIDWERMKEILAGNREFMLRLFENANLPEHELFSDLLQATFHLIEELLARSSFKELPEPDLKHLAGDMLRVYERLTGQWILYLQHLKKGYPYLFSLAVRQNPFGKEQSVIITL